MITNQEYIKKVFGVEYRFNTNNMTRPKDKKKTKIEGHLKENRQ